MGSDCYYFATPGAKANGRVHGVRAILCVQSCETGFPNALFLGDGSKEWTADWMQRLDHRFGDDGVFWISFEDLLKKYQFFERTRLFGPDWQMAQQWTTVNVPWARQYNDTYFSLSLAKTGPVVIVLSQLDDRYFRGLQGQYRFRLAFRLHKPNSESYLVRSESLLGMTRSVNVDLDLDAGEYDVRIQIEADRWETIMAPEDVIRKNAKDRRDKLMRMGMAYDFVHGRGKIVDSEQDKKAREAYEQRQKDKQMKERRDRWRLGFSENSYLDVKKRSRQQKRQADQRVKRTAKMEKKREAARQQRACGEDSRAVSVTSLEPAASGEYDQSGVAKPTEKHVRIKIAGEAVPPGEGESREGDAHCEEFEAVNGEAYYEKREKREMIAKAEQGGAVSSNEGKEMPSSQVDDHPGVAEKSVENPYPSPKQEDDKNKAVSKDNVPATDEEAPVEEIHHVHERVAAEETRWYHEANQRGDGDVYHEDAYGRGNISEARGHYMERPHPSDQKHCEPDSDDLSDLSDPPDISDHELDLLLARERPMKEERDDAPVAKPAPTAPLDEFEIDPWNAVAVVGIRVYYRVAEGEDATEDLVTIKVVRPDPYEDLEAEGEAESGSKTLDVDDCGKDATLDNDEHTGEDRRKSIIPE